ncbi:hypothetical protein D3Y57_07890 [Sphingomonas paeninsulae]|uniref:Uncharacterized protein n=2 Tax=Sphingomonas paeninsulae TaxID=2319844 RepID=A0A494TKF1_SPHPE|nr:hypothetical protein D3Y57_07890 [Sphingomonas paeninsulae]
MFVSLATVYVVAMMIAEAPLSWLGGIRFLGIMALCVSIPLGLLFGGLLLLRTGGGITAVILGLSLLAALIAIPLLSAWPVTQALSGVFVSPVRILRSTKGYRWGLFTASYASTVLNKILPATDTAKSGGQAIILAIGNGAISCISLLLLASIAATAWKFAIRQDATLAKSIEFQNY